MKENDTVVYIGDDYNYFLLKYNQYIIRCVTITKTYHISYIVFKGYEHIGHFKYDNNFLTLKEYRKYKIEKINERNTDTII